MSHTWKNIERAVAKRVFGWRIPVTGQDRDGADVISRFCHYQVKHRKSQPAYLVRWLEGIRRTAQEERKTGVVVWHKPGTPLDESLVVLSLKDWIDQGHHYDWDEVES